MIGLLPAVISSFFQLINSDVAFKMAPFLQWKLSAGKPLNGHAKQPEIQSRSIIKQKTLASAARRTGAPPAPAPERHLASEHSIRMTLCG
jgi:hypothetical protein